MSRSALLSALALAWLVPATWAADIPADPYAELHYWYPLPKADQPAVITVDVCVYGATPAGVTAAIQATRMGRTAALVEFSRHVGGLTSSGLSATDGGNAIGGLALEFYKGLGKRRGFLPAEAEARFRAMLAEANVQLLTEHRLSGVSKDGAALTAIDCEDGDRVQARMFVDATYEGDLLARAGVAFAVGREANAQYGETLDGVQKPGSHNFTRAVDPFVTAGRSRVGAAAGHHQPRRGRARQRSARATSASRPTISACSWRRCRRPSPSPSRPATTRGATSCCCATCRRARRAARSCTTSCSCTSAIPTTTAASRPTTSA